ncbi:outer membrane beta-barrel protein [Rickettsiella endosymbiont of Miltochrista miniata]|uniref:outer membrane beta-barrel protein n=1 Tax=Rickettsiella endosymbiont of Miltochrista miniata TaxID=3066239 RepID=UPI00313B3109
MFKKIITVSVLGVSALGMMAANATSNGVYVTGQVGYAHRANLTSAQGFQSIQPIFGGFVNAQSDVSFGKPETSAKNLMGRLAIGYQFTPNWAVELGYLQLSKETSSIGISNTTTAEVYPYPVITKKSTQVVTLKQHAFDVVGKGIIPINDKFNVYAKAGMAYVVSSVSGDSAKINGEATSVIAPIAKHNWAPEAGIGLTYDITPNVFIDTSFTHIQPIGKNKPSNIDFATVGLGYSFG